MSEVEFESYLRLLGRFLKLNPDQREAVARELRAHMEDRLEELLEKGYTREEATRVALDEFGDAAMLASEFGRIGRRRKWIMRTTTATVTIAATILLVSFLLPERRLLVPAPPFGYASGQAGGPAASPAPASPAPRPQVREIMAGESEADQRVLDQMKVMLTAVEFAEGTGFAEVIDWLRIQTKLSIDVNWPALALANIERTTDTGGLALRDVKAETMLEILLGKVGAASGGIAKLGWQVVDGVVRISTIDDLNTRTIVRIYDCQDLIGESATPLQRALLDTMAKHARAGTASTRPSPANAPKAIEQALPSDPQALAEALSNSRAEDVDTFVDMIISTIEPGSWAPEGTLGSICEYDGLLIVRHTWRTQQQVVKLLNNLRQAKAARSTGVGTAGTSPAADSGVERRGQTSARDLLPSILCVYS